MLLTLDIGNTRAKLVSFVDGHPRLEAACAVSELPAAFAAIAAHRPEVTSLRWCSVGADDALVETLLARIGWPTRRLVAAAEVGGVRLAYRTPHTLGVDRLAAVLGARSLQPQGHLLVIDAGTCITFDVASQRCTRTPRVCRSSMRRANCPCSVSTPPLPCAVEWCAALPMKLKAMCVVCAKNMEQLVLF